MTDRELLELAAKAAGIQCGEWMIAGVHQGFAVSYGERPNWICWNPLTDDGDALRLAVACALHVEIGRCWNRNGVMFGEDIMQGEMKATRRAIVRAAAEIGKGMA